MANKPRQVLLLENSEAISGVTGGTNKDAAGQQELQTGLDGGGMAFGGKPVEEMAQLEDIDFGECFDAFMQDDMPLGDGLLQDAPQEVTPTAIRGRSTLGM